MELFGLKDPTNTFTLSSFSPEWRSCAGNQNFAAAQVDESKSFPRHLGPALRLERIRGGFAKPGSLSGKQMNTDVVFFPFYRLFMSCKFLLQKSGSCFNGTERPRPFVATRFSKTNDTQSHKALAAACCRGRQPTV